MELIKLSVSRMAAREELESPTSLKEAICLDVAWLIPARLARGSLERGRGGRCLLIGDLQRQMSLRLPDSRGACPCEPWQMLQR